MNWDDVAQHFGVKRCATCASGNHTTGWTRNGYVHWSDRHVTKLGLRRFLMLIAEARIIRPETDWGRLYAYNVWASKAAQDIHIRMPARYSDNDRARVRWLITKDEHVPDAVKRWARGRSHEYSTNRSQAGKQT